MTVTRLNDEMPPGEFFEWQAYDAWKPEAIKRAREEAEEEERWGAATSYEEWQAEYQRAIDAEAQHVVTEEEPS